MAEKNYFIYGVTNLLILSLLDKKDRYGYEIIKLIEKFSDGDLVIYQTTIYAAIYKLLDAEYISEYNKLVGRKRKRVYYKLEPKGREYMDKIKKNYYRHVIAVEQIFQNLAKEE